MQKFLHCNKNIFLQKKQENKNMKPKVIQLLWKNINAKLALICLIIALLCTGFVLFTETLFADFKKQQEQYRHNTQILLETNDLVTQFYNIQEYTNLFLVHKKTQYLNVYQVEIDTFQLKLENIVQSLQQENKDHYFIDIVSLLQEKKEMLKQLQELFDNKNDIDLLYNKILTKLEKDIDNVLFLRMESNSLTLNDTVWQKSKSFGQRLKEAFRPTKKTEKNIASVNTVIQSDSINQSSMATTPMIDSLFELTRAYRYQYKTKIERIEIELYALLTADQRITKEITTLLLRLHENMLLNVISLGKEHENNAYHMLRWGVVAGAIALLLITVFIILIFKNIKTIQTAHKALRLEKQKTEELMESRHQLLLAISHDIKTPLGSLLGYLEIWEKESLSPKHLRELNTMQYSGKYIMSLLNNLLEFTRLERHKSQITKEKIEITPFFMDILEMFQPLCNVKNNTLTYNIDIKENPQIWIDSLKLQQIVVNLISNAVKYTTNGNISVRMEEVCGSASQLKITISDTGKGIPKEKLATLFEPFTRVEKNSAGIEGSGLGLFVVKGLVDVMKGEIEIKTEENKGTSVAIAIPFDMVTENSQPSLSQHKSLKIGVIEDDLTQLQVITSILKKFGHSVITSTSKKEFANQLHIELINCNLIFTDLEIGDLNGYEVLQKIKSLSNVPVVCLSGNSTTSKKEFQQQGFYDFLEKPFTLNQLEKLLTKFINKTQ
jgi:signal transduction histidine kinase/CheY-like chemotaxis protein